jgi:hypothetical protein
MNMEAQNSSPSLARILKLTIRDFVPNKVGQAFQPAGSPDFPVRPLGD